MNDANFRRSRDRVSFWTGTLPDRHGPDVEQLPVSLWKSSESTSPAPFAADDPDRFAVSDQDTKTPFSASVPSGYRKRTSLNSRR